MSVFFKNAMKIFVFLIIVVVGFSSRADNINESSGFAPTDSSHANWVFFGMVESESGEIYDYLFKVQRDENQFRAIVSLFDSQTKKVIFQEDSSSKIENPQNFKWVIGQAFLRFNKISNSWVFGLENQNKKGFNFKVGMLNKPEDDPVTQYLRKGISFVLVQAGQLNGHIQLEDSGKDQFVTAKNTWFRQIWLTDPEKSQQLDGLLCSFNDGKGLYSMRVFESVALKDTVAGFFDSEGISKSISQFISIKKNQDDTWNIKISTPQMDLLLSDTFTQNDVIAGFISNGSGCGFCMLSQDKIGGVG